MFFISFYYDEGFQGESREPGESFGGSFCV
jgi:hypothetical protein